MTLKKTIKQLTLALEDLKAIDLKILDVRKLTTITDCMIIVSGRSNRQVRAMADKITDTAKDINLTLLGIEGKQQGDWILVDLGDIVVHIMHPETRDYYQLEKLWSQDAARLSNTH